MNTLLNKYKWSRLALGILTILLGAAIIVVAVIDKNPDKITQIGCIILGVYFMVLSLIAMIVGLIVEARARTVFEALPFAAAFGLGVALVLPVAGTIVNGVINTVAPICLMCLGAAYIVHSVLEMVIRISPRTWSYRLCVGLVTLVAGVFLWTNKDTMGIVYLILGIVIAIMGFVLTLKGAGYLRKPRSRKK